MAVGLLIVGGLLFLAAGAMITDMGRATIKPGEDPNTTPLYRADLVNVWGPFVAHFGAFLFVLGLVAAAIFLEELDIFVRLFMLILAFVAILLVLANSPTLFG